LCLALAAAGLWFGRGIAADRARQSAAQHLDAGALGAADDSLAWAERVDPGNYRTALLRAACARRLGEREAWRKAALAAEAQGAPPRNIQSERDLDEFRWGQRQAISAEHYEGLVAGGASPSDAGDAIVHGLVAQGQHAGALEFVKTWQSDRDQAASSYLLGVAQAAAGDREAARTEFEQALDRRPEHDLARFRLARLLEEQNRLDESLGHYEILLQTAPNRELWRLHAARVLRKEGRLESARGMLLPSSAGEVSSAVAMEMGEIEFESGHYAAAAEWFERADLEGEHVAESLRSAASNYALAGDIKKSIELFARIDDSQNRLRLQGELQRRLAIDPSDAVAAGELQHLSQAASDQPPAGPASALFLQHCGACHGPDGRGDGPAARHLFPRPRNLREDKYRLVSTASGSPTLADLAHVIRQGIPGAAMPPLANLSNEQVETLAAEVQQFFRQRWGDQSPAEDEPLAVPNLDGGNAESLARGKAVYFSSGCQLCHGDEGHAGNAPMMLDAEGRPTLPRDLVRDPLKGGPSAESLYLRIRLGMPGTPHPASGALEEADLVALVQYCWSLGQEPKQQFTNHERAMRAARRSPARAADPAAPTSTSSAAD
jgi:mono/diheme cytochrome c family protein